MRFVLTLLFFASLPRLSGQYADSLPAILRGKKNPDARLESRFSFIGNRVAGVLGVRLGVTFSKRLKVGGGLSWMNSELPVTVTTSPEITARRYLKFAYFCAYTDFVFHKTKRWQLSVPLQLGAGQVWLQRRSALYHRGGDTKYLVVFYEPGITVQFKIFRWLGLGNDIAYRFAFRNRHTVPVRLSSPTYAFKILIWPDQLWYLLAPEHRVSKKYGPATW